jgi:hypothetical protein
VAPEAILERRLIPRNNEPVVRWLIHWMNLSVSEATWEDADFIRRVFPSFHPWGQGCQGGGIVRIGNTHSVTVNTRKLWSEAGGKLIQSSTYMYNVRLSSDGHYQIKALLSA